MAETTSSPQAQTASTGQTPGSQIRVFIVDDHSIVRDGLRMVLANEPDLELIGESDGKDAEEIDRMVSELIPDIVLLDIRLDGHDGFNIASQIKQVRTATKIIMLTGYESELYVSEALHQRVDGFITKDASKNYITTAIRMVNLGGSVWQSDVLYKAVRNIMKTSAAQRQTQIVPPSDKSLLADTLTPQEMEILHALGEGASNKAISAALQLHEPQVKKLVHNILNKLGVSNRTQAALYISKAEAEPG